MQDIRWKQSFRDFEKAFHKLKDTVSVYKQDSENELIQTTLIKAFEYTFELGWIVIKDYLEFNNVFVELVHEIIEEGFRLNLISSGKIWMEMKEHKKSASEIISEEAASLLIDKIIESFLPEFEQVYAYLSESL